MEKYEIKFICELIKQMSEDYKSKTGFSTGVVSVKEIKHKCRVMYDNIDEIIKKLKIEGILFQATETEIQLV